jgi:hypothetical protein
MKVRTIILAILMATGATLVAAGSLTAQTDPSKPQTARFGNPTSIARNLQGYVYGVVKKIGDHELILDKTEFGDNQVFKLEPKTKFIHDGKASSLADLKTGQGVWIDLKREKKTGELIAKKVVTGVDPTRTP